MLLFLYLLERVICCIFFSYISNLLHWNFLFWLFTTNKQKDCNSNRLKNCLWNSMFSHLQNWMNTFYSSYNPRWIYHYKPLHNGNKTITKSIWTITLVNPNLSTTYLFWYITEENYKNNKRSFFLNLIISLRLFLSYKILYMRSIELFIPLLKIIYP